MDRYINCMAHNSSEGQLLIGDTHAALFDCGMAFCAEETIQNIKNALNGRALDYIFITHTHYDHIGALPFIRREWPDIRLLTTESGAGVLLKETPRRVIRELSAVAAREHGAALGAGYSDDGFRADGIVKDGDAVSLGGLTVEVIETPGHTRDALSFFIPELTLLILCETPGVLMPDGTMYPCYLTGFDDTIRSIEKCRAFPFTVLSLPHRGIAGKEDAGGYFEKALKANTACRGFILDMKDQNLTEEEMLEAFYQRYGSEVLLTYQPKDAFLANARATINCTLREVI